VGRWAQQSQQECRLQILVPLEIVKFLTSETENGRTDDGRYVDALIRDIVLAM
jgi:hypothetical protein